MPPVGSMMSDEQVADVVNYVRTHFGNSYGRRFGRGGFDSETEGETGAVASSYRPN